MMPGLIEAHAHLITLGHGNYATWFPWINAHGGEQKLLQVMETAAKELLMGRRHDRGRSRCAASAEPDDSRPDQQGTDSRAAHVDERSVDRQAVSEAAQGAMQVGFGGLNISSSEQAASETERLATAGVDAIKAHAGLTLDDYTRDCARRASSIESRVHAHVYAETDVRHALESGVDVLQHVGSAGTAPPYSADS